ncbi:hypothetical protein J4859_14600 [Atopobium sp. oral taxon 416]|nr:hypothetical protein J4859_14600 [Atopobium sp. oral taxon 416]
MTVVANRDTTIVVWVADGYDKSALEQFYKGLSKEQLASIRVVSGDAACWIKTSLRTLQALCRSFPCR